MQTIHNFKLLFWSYKRPIYCQYLPSQIKNPTIPSNPNRIIPTWGPGKGSPSVVMAPRVWAPGVAVICGDAVFILRASGQDSNREPPPHVARNFVHVVSTWRDSLLQVGHGVTYL